MNLAGLLQVGSAAAGDMPAAESAWQKVLAGRQALQQAQRQQQAQEALFASLITPASGAVPQQGPPGGMPSMQPPPAAPGGGPPGGGPMSIPAGPPSPNAAPGQASPSSAPPQTAAPPAGGASAPPVQPAGGLQMPDPVARLRQMAQRLKQANPQLDNATLAAALGQQVSLARGLAPDDRAILQAETQVMRIQAQADAAAQRAQSALDAANIRADAARQIADLRAEVARRGQDVGADTADKNRGSRETIAGERDSTARRGQDITSGDRQAAEAGRNTRSAASEAGRNSRAQARIDASGASAQVKAQYKQMAAQRAAIKDQIGAFTAGTPGAPKKDEVAQLQAQLKDLDGKMAAFWSRNQQLPRPSEIDRMGGGPAAGAPAAQPAPSPAGAPAIGTVEDGFRFKGGNPADPEAWERVAQ